jgi:ATP-dependent Clp protease ATP-binding subunit ClpB
MAARRITLAVTPRARLVLAEKGYDAEFGARPLKRLIQKTIADAAALLILEGKVGEGGSIVVDAIDGEFTVRAQDLVAS